MPSTTLRKISKFHLISWCGNFVERHSFRRVSGDFHTAKLGEITVFYAVQTNPYFSKKEFCCKGIPVNFVEFPEYLCCKTPVKGRLWRFKFSRFMKL